MTETEKKVRLHSEAQIYNGSLNLQDIVSSSCSQQKCLDAVTDACTVAGKPDALKCNNIKVMLKVTKYKFCNASFFRQSKKSNLWNRFNETDFQICYCTIVVYFIFA